LIGLASGICNDMVVDNVGWSYIGNYGLNTDLKTRRVGPAEIIMVTPEGKAQAFACMLGGTDRRTLFITTVNPNSRVRTAVQLEVVKVEVQGAGLA
jgi:hypothetical protein